MEYQKLLNAFSDPDFQKEINQYRHDIELELVEFIEWLLTILKSSQKIFRSPESRIKSKAGFAEKINRKDYINKWAIDSDMRKIQDEILIKLPDLIGFRLTCFFMDDEEVIYNKLKEYSDSGKFQNIILNFDERTEQKNGHKIYKVSGSYKEKVSFELQIKSVVHNIWGEVEHKTIYKRSQYAVDLEQRQTITEEIFNILKASDQQLLSLFIHQYDEEKLVCGLFAEQTRHKVEQASNTEYLAGHYKSFFDIFLKTGQKDIWNYVSCTLVGKQYERKKIKVEDDKEKILEFAKEIKTEFLEYYLKIQYVIAQELYIFADFDMFILYLAKIVMDYLPMDEEQDYIEDDVFVVEEEDRDLDTGYNEEILKLLKDKLPDALKERK